MCNQEDTAGGQEGRSCSVHPCWGAPNAPRRKSREWLCGLLPEWRTRLLGTGGRGFSVCTCWTFEFGTPGHTPLSLLGWQPRGPRVVGEQSSEAAARPRGWQDAVPRQREPRLRHSEPGHASGPLGRPVLTCKVAFPQSLLVRTFPHTKCNSSG